MTKTNPIKGSSIFLLETAAPFAESLGIKRILIVTRKPLPWDHLKNLSTSLSILLLMDSRTKNIPVLKEIETLLLDLPDTSPLEWLEICLQKALKQGKVKRGERLLCLYPLSPSSEPNSLSILQLKEKTEYLSFQNLDKLSDAIPTKVLGAVVDIAMELAREGREGKSIGCLFVVGDAQKVMEFSRPMILNPFHGYPEDQRMITDPNLAETVKEIAQIDGAFVIRFDGMILSGGRHIDTSAKGVKLPKGLGARHIAAASISKTTEAVAVTVSSSTRTVRIFRKGKIAMESKPLRGLWI